MRKRLPFLIITLVSSVLVASLLVAPACRAKQEKPIRLGVLAQLTGFAAEWGVDGEKAVRFGLEQVGYKVAGKTIEVITEDTASNPATALEKAKKLVELNNVDLILHLGTSDQQEATGPYLKEKKIIAQGIYTAPWEFTQYGNWVVTSGTLDSTAIPLGDYAWEQGMKTMITVGQDYVGGRQVIQGIANRFKERGGQTIQEHWIPFGTPDPAPYITSMKKADAVAVMLLGSDMMSFLKQYLQSGLKMPLLLMPLLLTEAEVILPEQLAALGSAVVGQKGIMPHYYPTLDFPVNKKFVADFKAKFGYEPSYKEGPPYRGVQIYLAGLEATKGDPKLDVLRPAILGLNIDTVSGPIRFSKNGFGISNRYVAEVEVKDGKYGWKIIKTYTDVRDPRDK